MLRPILCYAALAIFLAGCNPPRALPYDEDMGSDASDEMTPTIDEPPDTPRCVDAATDCAEQPNASATCEAGACQYSCAQGWGDPEGLAATQGCLCDVMTEACGVPYCGNGATEGEEGCDNGPLNDDATPDACRTSCQPATCNDGVQDTGEVCDDGNDDNTDDCTTECTLCGNGRLDPGEECDDGGVPSLDGDGCSKQCVVERYWGCTRDEPSTCWPWLVDYDQPPNPSGEGGVLEAICINDKYVFVSSSDEIARARGVYRGKVLVFLKSDKDYELVNVIRPDDLSADANSGFGISLGCSNEYLMVGAPRTDFSGDVLDRVYIYRVRQRDWVLDGILQDGMGTSSYGGVVAVNGNHAMVTSEQVGDMFGNSGPGALFYTLDSQTGAWLRNGQYINRDSQMQIERLGYFGDNPYLVRGRMFRIGLDEYFMPEDLEGATFYSIVVGDGRVFASYSRYPQGGGVLVYSVLSRQVVGRIDIEGYGTDAGGLIYKDGFLFIGAPSYFEDDYAVGRVYKVGFGLNGEWLVEDFYKSPIPRVACGFGKDLLVDGERIYVFSPYCDSYREGAGAVFIIDPE